MRALDSASRGKHRVCSRCTPLTRAAWAQTGLLAFRLSLHQLAIRVTCEPARAAGTGLWASEGPSASGSVKGILAAAPQSSLGKLCHLVQVERRGGLEHQGGGSCQESWSWRCRVEGGCQPLVGDWQRGGGCAGQGRCLSRSVVAAPAETVPGAGPTVRACGRAGVGDLALLCWPRAFLHDPEPAGAAPSWGGRAKGSPPADS